VSVVRGLSVWWVMIFFFLFENCYLFGKLVWGFEWVLKFLMVLGC